MNPDGGIATRKLDHVRINLREDVSSAAESGFERYRLVHRALPEIDLADVDPSTTVFGRRLAAPLLVSSMTGGAPGLEALNRRLAEAAQRRRIAIGVGSQRAALESRAAEPSFRVRDAAPDCLLLANLGAVQLNYGYGLDACRRVVADIQADALILHLNPLQEAVQPEGDTRFGGLLRRIGAVAQALEVPVVVKEVGWGIGAEDARRLFEAGVAAVDVAGAGGTSWTEVERHRAADARGAAVAAAFRGWGLPTAECLVAARAVAGSGLVFASGGIRDGVDAAKALALGASLVGLAGPLLRAAEAGEEALDDALHVLDRTLRVAMFAAGAPNLGVLAEPGRVVRAGG